MGTYLASALITDCRYVLQDPSGTRWTDAELLLWLNIGQLAIAMGKPDASYTIANIQLAAGTKQSLPSGGLVLMNVVRSMGTNGTTAGRALKPMSREMMDTLDPDWHAAAASATPKVFIYDSRNPKAFYVYPPQPSTGSVYVEAAYSVAPTFVAAVGNAITIDDIYRGILVDYMLFRAFSKDDEVGDASKAAFHLQQFSSAMGLKANGDAAMILSQQASYTAQQPQG